jgi:hypothetical protein
MAGRGAGTVANPAVSAVFGALPSGLTLEQEILARPEHLTLFISSKMSGGALKSERRAVARAVEALDIVKAWYWERDAKAGPVSAVPLCVNKAAASELLVLILEDDLTPTTHKEYMAAKKTGAWCCILVKEGGTLTPKATRFIKRESKAAVYKRFRNASELRTHVMSALYTALLRGVRYDMFYRRLNRKAALTTA